MKSTDKTAVTDSRKVASVKTKIEQIKANVTCSFDRPEVGQTCVVRNLNCRITKVLPFGTIDVESIEGNKAFRVTGLAFI